MNKLHAFNETDHQGNAEMGDMGKCTEAVLSSCGDMTSFTVGDCVIRFKTSRNLIRYEEVTKWDDGYIECRASYGNPAVTEDDYIDLVPILENLYFDPSDFLRGIERVKVQYA